MILRAEREQGIFALTVALGVTIKDFSLFDRALTHSSTAAEPGGPGHDYESLEFLGDAVLGLATANFLYCTYPDRTPGEYSKMRAGLVSRTQLARVAKRLNLAPLIQLGRGEEMAGGRQRTALLADCLESLIGAIYLDQGWEEAQRFVVNVFQEEFSRAEHSNRFWDYKSRLQVHCQAVRKSLPCFKVIRESGPDHRKEFEIEVLVEGESLGLGMGLSKKEAEQMAARGALDRMGIHIG